MTLWPEYFRLTELLKNKLKEQHPLLIGIVGTPTGDHTAQKKSSPNLAAITAPGTVELES